jgi:transposase
VPVEIDPKQLPEDPSALRQMVIGLLEEAEQRERKLRQLQHLVEQLLRARFGPRRERVDEHRLFLFAAAILAQGGTTPAASDEAKTPPSDSTSSSRPGHGRQLLPKSLQRQRVVYDLGEGQRQCPECQEQMRRIGEDVSERLEYVPASLVVIEEACQKYACPKGCTVVTAGKPMAPIGMGLPGPGLLAHVAVSKHADHLPLYRQEEISHRQGVELSRQTMCDWMRQCAELVSTLYELVKKRVLGSKAVQTDDTPVPVLDPDLSRTRTGRIWTYVGDDEHPYTVYDCTPNRSRDGPDAFLQDFHGYLRADTYSGCDHLHEDPQRGIVEVACWARARRVVAKAEHLEKGANPRFVVTSMSAEDWQARCLYEELYCARGEMENRIKGQLMLFADRTSTALLRSNQVRLYFSLLAYGLMQAQPAAGAARDGTGAGAVLDASSEAAEDRRADSRHGAKGLDLAGRRLRVCPTIRAGLCATACPLPVRRLTD